ncbi:amino acid transporter [Photobacterium kishitanii]|uniref:LysE family translocator n=1 Tax=Photobacterium kishitanii TaxID=318456 RepID=A0AAX0YWR5_9GAMM|nr:LysE family translocator [Photobacterium kishitanii]KJG55446.1 amino acid transporter [Photobacterium kishitanii]KJG61108.1 amino acid transporter [Photobacterium kishitanii]KJG65269.1 amino acid transporter [Photobacterium kishitanii]KJG67027.1 amino acid transporter [Photobacterium kishitanii]PSX21000.1 LysE family translocator [Photobacterium kishitanii]
MELLFNNYLSEFIAVLSITVLTIIIPGPDFFIVVRNSLAYTRRSGIFTTLGVSFAVWIHVIYTLAGIGLILSKSIVLFTIVKYLGAAYLMYLGWQCLKSRPLNSEQYIKQERKISDYSSFKMGFINNALNPKATLFFLSLFTQVVSVETPFAIQIIYGATVSLSCLIWFSLVAVFLNQKSVKNTFESIQHYFEKLMGVVLITFGIKVALASK